MENIKIARDNCEWATTVVNQVKWFIYNLEKTYWCIWAISKCASIIFC
jgi:hypothetical protein